MKVVVTGSKGRWTPETALKVVERVCIVGDNRMIEKSPKNDITPTTSGAISYLIGWCGYTSSIVSGSHGVTDPERKVGRACNRAYRRRNQRRNSHKEFSVGGHARQLPGALKAW